MSVEIVFADYGDESHAMAIIDLLDHYARDPMGGSEPLSAYTRENLIDALAQVPGAFTLLAYVEGKPVGLINSFEGFSTFNCRPLVNIHDVAVLERFRGKGIGRKLFEGVAAIARERGCCKLTLEVLEGNENARHLYSNLGFEPYRLRPEAGAAQFWQMKL